MLLANAVYENIEKGGPIMAPILIALVIGLVVVVGRLLWWAKLVRRMRPAEVERALHAVAHGDRSGALDTVANAECPHLTVLAAGLRHDHTRADLAMQLRAGEVLADAERSFWILGTVITLAPLLGLLGTVTGIMGAFDFGGDLDGASAKVTGGIAEALIATAWGLAIAIAGVIAHGWLRRRSAKLRAALDRTAKRYLVAREDSRHPGLRADFAMAESAARTTATPEVDRLSAQRVS